MKEITLTIDGKVCKGVQGETILEIANKNEVYIPTLCYLEGLTPIGSCRMCVVEVENNPKLLTACTTPAQDGMVVHTKTEKLYNYRRQILELLFAGRNHYCMFCSQSEDCELQRLAIEHGMDHVRYPFLYADFENDASDADLQMDHNRCILCLRCIRVCAEKVGAHTLDLQKRGWDATVISDLGQKLGESDTCVDCGACAQVCPTGTITVREFAYRGKRNDCDDIVESVCPLCAVGCRIKAYVRTGTVARVEGTGTSQPDGGQLCHKGRWHLPESTERERVTTPMIREGVHYREASWEEALSLVAEEFKESYDNKSAGALVSSLCTDEELGVFSAFFKEGMQMSHIDTFDGDVLRGFARGFEPFRRQGVRPFTAAHNLLDSDCIVTLCADPQDEAPVVASYVRVATLKNEATLVNVSSWGEAFPGLTDINIPLKRACGDPGMLNELAAAVSAMQQSAEMPEERENLYEEYEQALTRAAEKADVERETMEQLVKCMVSSEKTTLVLGGSVATDPNVVTAAANLAIAAQAFRDDGLGLVPLVRSGNSLGTINTMLSDEPWIGEENRDFLYVYSTGLVPEDKQEYKEHLAAAANAKFVVVQTPYMVKPLVNFADVLLPAPAWYERSGHYCTIEGERRKLNVIVPPRGEVKGLATVFDALAEKMGITIRQPEIAPCASLFESKIPASQAQMVTEQGVTS
ncbi:MAG: molybdopterin-dependent oxidoreductase [Synergistales bacterium]|nr:molybdopterin-dependent oxidoreductase [Synergistales bacterium]